MDDNELRDVVAERAGVPVETADRVIVAFQDTVLICVKQNEDVVLNGFGMFHRCVHSDETPAFSFLVDLGDPVPPIPEECIAGFDSTQREALTTYLMENPTNGGDVFDVDHDRYPGLDPRWKPEAITGGEVRRASHRGTRISPTALASRVVDNLRVTIG